MVDTFERLVAEADAVDVSGWDFSWLDGRATEERPPWTYQRSMSRRMATAARALDIQTGGGEVLAGAAPLAPHTVATESWPPNVRVAAERLEALGVSVVEHDDATPLPFADGAFDLVVSRHPVATNWAEVGRVLRRGGVFYSQQVGPRTSIELTEYFLGPQTGPQYRDPALARASAEAAGLEIVDLREARLRMEFFDIGAVVYFLRKVLWTVPDFTVDRYRDRLRDLHERIARDGVFLAHSTRFLIDAVKR